MNFDKWQEQAQENLKEWIDLINDFEVEEDNLKEAYFDIVHLNEKTKQFLQIFKVLERGKREKNIDFSIDNEGSAVLGKMDEDSKEKMAKSSKYIG